MSTIYQEAGRVVDAVVRRKLGLKAALYESPLESDPRVVCKLAASALGHRGALKKTLQSCGILTTTNEEEPSETSKKGAKTKKKKLAKRKSTGEEANQNDDHCINQEGGLSEEGAARMEGTILVMAFDLLLGKGLKGGGTLRKMLVSKLPSLQANFKEFSATAKQDAAQGVFETLPRYIRVNRMILPEQSEVDTVVTKLTETLREKASKVKNEENQEAHCEVKHDPDVPNLLTLDHRTKPWLQGQTDVTEGRLILQDKSSCLAAICAGLKPGTFVLDACAAPGSKTAHALELLGGRGRLLACERDPDRASALVSRLKLLSKMEAKGRASAKAHAEGDKRGKLKHGTNLQFKTGKVRVDVRVGDFLTCNPNKKPFRDVEVLIVDPSCSGSGLPEHRLADIASGRTGVGAKRLRRLAAFQKKILAHALRFPKARTVVYSTCSTHRTENEDVVAAVLAERSDFKVVPAKPSWKNPPAPADGESPLPPWASHCLHCDPATHRCRGFFLCRLDRSGPMPTEAELQRLGSKKGKRGGAAKKNKTETPAEGTSEKRSVVKKGAGLHIVASSSSSSSKQKKQRRK